LNLDCNYNFDYSNYTINTINKENNNNKYPSYSVNNNREEELRPINKRINMSKVNKDNTNTINNNKLLYNENLNLSNQNNRYIKNYNKDIKKNELENNNSSKERYIILDMNGNPIFINGKRLLGMAFKDYKEIKDNNKKIIYENQNDEFNYIKNLKPILLDNGSPLVNEENMPYLGINNMFFIDENENPIVGSRELYKNNKVVQGELGIIPKNNKGNLSIK
jgi:hypothetical protein